VLPDRRQQKGIAVVEFAVGVLVVLFLMLAVVEIGRAYYTYATLTKAVRSGARYIAINARNSVGLVDLNDQNTLETKNLMIYGDIGGGEQRVLSNFETSDISLSRDDESSGAANPYVRVKADYNYVPLLGEISRFGVGGGTYELRFTMSSASNMRVLK